MFAHDQNQCGDRKTYIATRLGVIESLSIIAEMYDSQASYANEHSYPLSGVHRKVPRWLEDSSHLKVHL